MNVTADSGAAALRPAKLVYLAASVAAALGAAPAGAQQQGARLEEVVVTARYREEDIQTTPIAITAFSGGELEARSLDNVEDIGVVIPNAFFRKNTGNYGPSNTIGLRGLNQVDFSYAFEPAVGVYIDDIYHGTLTGADMDLLDLERVEVLRGPQGTLFGKNSLGGSIRLISTKPEGEDSGRVQVTYGEFDRLDVRASGDFRITDNLYTRLVGLSKRRDGFGRRLDFTCEMIRRGTPELAGLGDGVGGWDAENNQPVMVEPGSEADNDFALPAARDPRQGNGCALGSLGGEQTEAGRVMLRYLPTDRLEVNVSADFSSTGDDPNVEAQLSPVIAGPGALEQLYEDGMIHPNYGIDYTNTDQWITGDPYTNYATHADPFEGQTYPPEQRMDVSGGSVVVDYDIGPAVQAKLIAGYREYTSEWNSDTDRTPFPIEQTHYLQEHDQTQLEAQLTGTVLEDRLEWTSGLFYYDSESRAYNTTEFGAFDFAGVLPNFVADDGYTTENHSAFVHLNYYLTDNLSISGGLRYTDEEKTNTFAHYGQIVVPDPLVFGDSRSDFKLSVDYSASDAVFLYAQAATGFRSEGANPRIFTVGQLGSIPSEEVTTYEIGVKSDLLDNQIRLNAAAFHSDYDPRVISAFGLVNQCDAPSAPDPTPYFLSGGDCPDGTFFAGSGGLPWFFYTNSPGVLEGFEVELTATPTDNLTLSYSAGHTTYENDNQDPTDPLGMHPSWLLQPEWTMSLGADYVVNLGNGGRLTPRVDAFYQSERTNGGTQVNNFCPERCIPSYTILNARLTYEPPNGEWMLSLAGTNLTDKLYWQQLDPEIDAFGNPASNRSGVPSRPREWAFTLEKRF